MDFQPDNHQPQGLYGLDDNYQNSFGSANVKPPVDVESQSGSAQKEPQLQQQPQENQQKATGCCGIFQIEYYQPFFNVTSAEVKNKLINVLIPNKPEFQSKKNPDLWGPFWVLTTVVFLLCVCGNLSSYISNQELYQVNFKYAPLAAALIYGIGICFPILLSILIKCFGADTTPFEAICLYGYSMACFAIVAALNTIPFSWLQWILTVYGFINSTIFIIVNIYGDIRNLPSQKKYIILGVIGCFQVAFMLSFKLFFFDVFS
ncbi:hypothetical protein ABPG72_010262 [Tetrahymena utriculariae]